MWRIKFSSQITSLRKCVKRCGITGKTCLCFQKVPRVIPSLFFFENFYFVSYDSWFFKFFYWRINALWNFVVFYQTSTWISHRYLKLPWKTNRSDKIKWKKHWFATQQNLIRILVLVFHKWGILSWHFTL